MRDKFRAAMIGLFVAGALCIVASILVFLKPSFGDNQFTLKVRFPNIEKINVGTRVTFAGRPIGQVSMIYPVEDARQSASGVNVYAYELVLRLDSKIKLYSSDSIQTQTSGLLGERVIAIVPQPDPKGEAKPIEPGELLYAHVSPSVEDAFQRFGRLAYKAELALDHFNHLLETGVPEVKSTLKDIAKTSHSLKTIMEKAVSVELVENLAQLSHSSTKVMNQVHTLLSGLDDKRVVQDIQGIMQHIHQILAAIDQPTRISDLLAQSQMTMSQLHRFSLRVNESWPKIEQAIVSLSHSSEHVENFTKKGSDVMDRFALVADRLHSGQGTLGRLIMKDDFYLNLCQTTARANILLSDINNYGLLFHTNRTWKSQRAYQMDKLSSLKSPEAFERFWTSQLQAVHINLGQLSAMLENAKQKRISGQQLGKQALEQSFSSVLRQLSELQDQLSLFSEQLKNRSSEEPAP